MSVQPASFTLDGKRYKLDALVPAPSIRYLCSFLHVSASDDAAKALVRNERSEHWPENLRRQGEQFAVHCHRRNQELYRKVMRG